MSKLRQCRACGAMLEEDDLFCPACGQRVQEEAGARIYCEQCGQANEPGDRFCMACGAPLSGAAAFAEERRGKFGWKSREERPSGEAAPRKERRSIFGSKKKADGETSNDYSVGFSDAGARRSGSRDGGRSQQMRPYDDAPYADRTAEGNPFGIMPEPRRQAAQEDESRARAESVPEDGRSSRTAPVAEDAPFAEDTARIESDNPFGIMPEPRRQAAHEDEGRARAESVPEDGRSSRTVPVAEDAPFAEDTARIESDNPFGIMPEPRRQAAQEDEGRARAEDVQERTAPVAEDSPYAETTVRIDGDNPFGIMPEPRRQAAHEDGGRARAESVPEDVRPERTAPVAEDAPYSEDTVRIESDNPFGIMPEPRRQAAQEDGGRARAEDGRSSRTAPVAEDAPYSDRTVRIEGGANGFDRDEGPYRQMYAERRSRADDFPPEEDEKRSKKEKRREEKEKRREEKRSRKADKSARREDDFDSAGDYRKKKKKSGTGLVLGIALALVTLMLIGVVVLFLLSGRQKDHTLQLPPENAVPVDATATVEAVAAPPEVATPTAETLTVPPETAAPTSVPTAAPTSVPTAAPTSVPTVAPTSVPTAAPTLAPTAEPFIAATPAPNPAAEAVAPIVTEVPVVPDVTGTDAPGEWNEVVAIESTNLRVGPSENYASIGVINQGDVMIYLNQTEYDSEGVLWYYIQYGIEGSSGWVSSEYARVSVPGGEAPAPQPEAAPQQPVSTATAAPASASGIIAMSSISLLSGPGAEFQALASIPGGTMMQYLGESATDASGGEWRRVSLNGLEGWVSANYTQLLN